jgi:hypothetical protein
MAWPVGLVAVVDSPIGQGSRGDGKWGLSILAQEALILARERAARLPDGDGRIAIEQHDLVEDRRPCRRISRSITASAAAGVRPAGSYQPAAR